MFGCSQEMRNGDGTQMATETKTEQAPVLRLEVRYGGVANVARRIGCHPGHLSYILHGHRKANETLRRRLARMGITTTVDGKEL